VCSIESGKKQTAPNNLLLAPAVLVEGPVWALIGHRNGPIDYADERT